MNDYFAVHLCGFSFSHPRFRGFEGVVEKNLRLFLPDMGITKLTGFRRERAWPWPRTRKNTRDSYGVGALPALCNGTEIL